MTGNLAPDLQAVASATDRLLDSLSGIDDDSVRRPSLLPGWSIGHVATHIARNADGMVNLVTWALTGEVTPMYASAEARAAAIEEGSTRPAAELRLDVHGSAARLDEALGRLSAAGPECQDRLVLFGPPNPGRVPDSPAGELPFGRLREVEIHHVDLGLDDYTVADWPVAFVARTLLWIGSRNGKLDVVGDPAELLAWRLGRGAGPSVRRSEGGDPGEPPAW